jgi:hypothetical protein
MAVDRSLSDHHHPLIHIGEGEVLGSKTHIHVRVREKYLGEVETGKSLARNQ